MVNSEQPDLEEFSPQKIGILNIIIDKFKDMSSAEISAMINISDGLSSELLHICNQSHCGCCRTVQYEPYYLCIEWW